ncbi:MAG TPA: aldehyde dehydrogenase family protein, partial [bacterium]|nr:aldehyde dehydrogenase family protein [bacterium]
MKFSDEQISSIVDKVVSQIQVKDTPPAGRPANTTATVSKQEPKKDAAFTGSRGCFGSIDDAIAASVKALDDFKQISLEQRKRIIQKIRDLCKANVELLSKMAREETGLGRVEDKIKKNLLAINKTPGVEDIEPQTFTGDHGFTLLEKAPWGVIGSITPCTNPTETIICNGIGMIAAGNTVVFNPHPTAKKISVFVIDLMNQAVISEGGPPNLFTTIATPTIASANQLMNHKDIKLLVVTGGPAVV